MGSLEGMKSHAGESDTRKLVTPSPMPLMLAVVNKRRCAGLPGAAVWL